MKKSVLIIAVLFLATGAVFAQSDLPTEAEAVKVIEGYFRCMGNGDTENLSKYIVSGSTELATLISTALDETQKKEFTSYKADIIEMRPINDRVTNTFFVRCSIEGNSFFSSLDIVKENGVWKIR
jgi:hypothetical protein